MTVLSFPFSNEDNSKLINALLRGDVLIFATETFYAIGCNALCHEAVKRIFEIKRRDTFKSLPLLINSRMVEGLQKNLNVAGVALTSEFWAGALTVVLPAPEWIPDFLRASDGSVAVRHSDCQTVSALLDLVDCPLIGTSANLSNEEPHTHLQSIPKLLKEQVDLMIDSGETAGEASSTIVSVMQKTPIILREGKLFKEVQRFLKQDVSFV